MLDNGGKQPDLVIEMPGRERLIVENKYAGKPVASLEDDCRGRLDEKWAKEQRASTDCCKFEDTGQI